MASPDDPSVVVLRNRGIPITVFKLDPATGLPMVANEETGEPVTTKRFVRFTANELVEIEDAWPTASFTIQEPKWVPQYDGAGNTIVNPETHMPVFVQEGFTNSIQTFVGVEAWKESMQRYGWKVIRKTLSILWVEDEQTAGRQMIPEQIADYSTALSLAFAIANGMEPEQVGKLLAAMREAARTKQREQYEAIAAELDKGLGTPGETGSESGAPETPTEWADTPPVEIPTPSGV